MSRRSFQFILDKVDQRLSNWKAKTLSFASHLTLTKFVIQGLPTYVMQAAHIPTQLCDDIDKRCRRFLWGDSNDARQLHTVSWRWMGPERIRIHLWKLAQGVLVTNAFRHQRGLTNDSTWPMCAHDQETILHMSRDCTKVDRFGAFLLETILPRNFYVDDLHQWLSNNLNGNCNCRGVKWTTLFGAATSCFWYVRNEKVFQGKDFSCKELECRVLYNALAFQTSSLESQRDGSHEVSRIQNSTQWCAPNSNFVKLNCDGAVCQFGMVVASCRWGHS